MKRSGIAATLAVILGAACSDHVEPTAPMLRKVQLPGTDAVPGFFFLPPMVADPGSFTGVFDPARHPAARVLCTGATGPGCPDQVRFELGSTTFPMKLDLEGENYHALWHTPAELELGSGRYRLQVEEGGAVLARAELFVAGSAGDAKSPPAETIPLIRGKPFQIKFRIEVGTSTVASIEVTPATSSLYAGETVQLTATLKDAGGQVVPGSPVWGSDNGAAASVNSSGLVTAIAPGTAHVSASAGGLSGSAKVTVALLPTADQLPGEPGNPAAGVIPDEVLDVDPESYQTGSPGLPGLPQSVHTICLILDRNATIQQINALLEEFHARIVGGISGVPAKADGILCLRLPSRTHAERDAALALIRQRPGVVGAMPDVLVEGDAVPSDEHAAPDWTWSVTPSGSNFNLEQMRVPQMWNFNSLAEIGRGQVITSVIDQGFVAHEDFPESFDWVNAQRLDVHGTHVLGILGAQFGNQKGIDGINPFVTAALASVWSVFGVTTRLAERLDIEVPQVINISLGYNWYRQGVDAEHDALAQVMLAFQGNSVGTALLSATAKGQRLPYIVTSAGNDSNRPDGFGDQPAKYASPWNYAALVLNMKPIIVVEAVEDNLGRLPISNSGGHLSAPGRSIFSLVEDHGYDIKTGTSQAAPHVTGLIGYLLSLKTDFPAPTIITNPMLDFLLLNARPTFGAPPMPDAFASAMDLDRRFGGERMLLRLLDIDDGSDDGIQRVNRDSVAIMAEDLDHDGRELGDGSIDMSDFRRFRDWLLKAEAQPGRMLDGADDHPKMDLNRDGITEEPADENIFPRGDFNGDGIMHRSRKALMRGVLAGDSLTDLQVLQSKFHDPFYSPENLDNLLGSGDVHVTLSGCNQLPNVAFVDIGAVRAGQNNFQQRRRVSSSVQEFILTLPVNTAGYTLQARAYASDNTTVIATFQEHKDFGLGQDVYFDPECEAIEIVPLASLSSIPLDQPRDVPFRVRRRDLSNVALSPVAEAAVTLSMNEGGAVTPLTTTTDAAGEFTARITRMTVTPPTLTVRAVAPNGPFRLRSFDIGAPDAVVIETEFVNAATATKQMSPQQLEASGGTGTYAWSIVAGALPPGISLSASGVLSGTPTQVGAFQFTVRAASGALATPGTRAYTMQILAADPWIGKWAGVIDQPGRRPDVSVTPLIASGGSSTLYTFFMGQGYVCNVTLTAPGSLSFSGYCSNGWDDQAISGSRSGTSITAVLEPSFSATLPSGNMTLNKLP